MGGSDNETLIVTMLSLILTLAGAGCATVVFAQTSLALRRKRADKIHATTGVVPVSVGQPARRWTALAETDSLNAQIAYLRRAVKFLHQKIGAEAAHSAKGDADLKAYVDQVQTLLHQSDVVLQARTAHPSTETIPLQLVGIFLVVLGTCVGVVPAAFGLT
jgi:hypothetical protein